MVAKRALRGTEPLGYVKPIEPELCPLCGRMLEPGASVDEHHLVPKSKGGKVKSLIHHLSPQDSRDSQRAGVGR